MKSKKISNDEESFSHILRPISGIFEEVFFMSGLSMDIIRLSRLSMLILLRMAILMRFFLEKPLSQSRVDTGATNSRFAPYCATSFIACSVSWPFSIFFSTNRKKLFISSVQISLTLRYVDIVWMSSSFSSTLMPGLKSLVRLVIVVAFSIAAILAWRFCITRSVLTLLPSAAAGHLW